MTSPSNGLSMVLGIYRRVLRIHKQVLPPPIRPVGDRYAKEEFQQHLRRDLSVPQWQEFLSQWSQYCLMLEGKSEKRLGAGGISEEVVQSMSPEQKLQLERLKLEAQMLGSQLLKPDGSSK